MNWALREARTEISTRSRKGRHPQRPQRQSLGHPGLPVGPVDRLMGRWRPEKPRAEGRKREGRKGKGKRKTEDVEKVKEERKF